MVPMLPDHHAVIVRADSISVAGLPETFTRPSIDVEIIESSTLSIGQVRSLIDLAYQRPVEAPKRSIVVVANTIAPEAQHALLKVLEEPPATTRFILVLASTEGLLPTLRSRLHFMASTSTLANAADFVAFCALSFGERMEIITKKAKEKDTTWMQHIFTGATNAASLSSSVSLKRMALTISEFQALRGASKKMLLEGIALTLPVKKS